MQNIEKSIDNLPLGKSKKIRGIIVEYQDFGYIIDGFSYNRDDAIRIIKERGLSRGMDYANTAFMLVKPPRKIVATRQIRNKSEHAALIQEAKDSGLYVFYASIEDWDGEKLATQPFIVDWDSVPDSAPKQSKPVPGEDKELYGQNCPYCGKTMSSGSGRTLHVKSKHPDKLREYIDEYRH